MDLNSSSSGAVVHSVRMGTVDPNAGSGREIFDTTLIDGCRVTDLDAGECLAACAMIQGEIDRWQAAQVVVLARFGQQRPAELDGGEQGFQAFDEFAADEVALRLRWETAEAQRRLALAVGAVRRMPQAVCALGAGSIDLERLTVLARATAPLSDEQVADIVGPVLDNGGGRASRRAFAAAVRRRVARVDPDGAQRRRRRACASRRVTVRPEEEGMGRLSALLPAERMLAAFRRIDQLARKAWVPGDERDLDQRRADVLVDLLLGRDRDQVRVEMQVIVSVATLLGLSENPAEVPGYGPIPAEVAREISASERCTWRRILVDPEDGAIHEVSRRRYPSAPLARYVRLRTPTCLFPGCDRPSVACDLDHTRPHSRGGETREGNLGPACRHHHRLRHAPARVAHDPLTGEPLVVAAWGIRQPESGHFVVTTPEGEETAVHPPRYDDL